MHSCKTASQILKAAQVANPTEDQKSQWRPVIYAPGELKRN